MKRLLSMLLILGVLVGLLGVTAYAAEDFLTYTPIMDTRIFTLQTARDMLALM